MIPEIPNTTLGDIAIVTWHTGPLPPAGQFYNGPIIYYNPVVCRQVGPYLSAFFHAHEYGHVHLNHIQRRFFESNPFSRLWMTQHYELEADAYAARSLLAEGNMVAVRQAIQWFYGQGPIQFVPTHPPGLARAQNLFNIAGHILG